MRSENLYESSLSRALSGCDQSFDSRDKHLYRREKTRHVMLSLFSLTPCRKCRTRNRSIPKHCQQDL